MESIDIMLLCIYAPFALAALWVAGCLFFGRTDLVPKFIARWFGRGDDDGRNPGISKSRKGEARKLEISK